jgi:hypothetical protein
MYSNNNSVRGFSKHKGRPFAKPQIGQLVEGQLEEVDEKAWGKFAESFL